jgi:HTH-type transcriptional regulator / antitoxin HipB
MANKTLAELIKTHRKEAGITQKELADMAGVGKTFVFDLEHGKKTLSLDKFFKVIKILNISLFLEGPFFDKIKIEF